MKIGHLQNIQSFETSIETENLQRYDEQSIEKPHKSIAAPQFRRKEFELRTLVWNSSKLFAERNINDYIKIPISVTNTFRAAIRDVAKNFISRVFINYRRGNWRKEISEL